jgi:hypothetical protein
MEKTNWKKWMRPVLVAKTEKQLNAVWRDLLEACDEQKVAADVVINWKLYRDPLSAKERSRVLCTLRAKGWDIFELRRVCSLSERRLRKILNSEKQIS